MALTKTERAIEQTAAEFRRRKPGIIAETRRKKGEAAALAQERAIFIEKVRKRDGRIPPPKSMAARRMLARARSR